MGGLLRCEAGGGKGGLGTRVGGGAKELVESFDGTAGKETKNKSLTLALEQILILEKTLSIMY
jgi:hypothetical protein